MTQNWTADTIPNQTDRVAIVTGANSGIGLETAKALAAKGATLVMACRNLDKADAAADVVRQEVADAKLDVIPLDLASLASVRTFAESFKVKYDRLDLLINNAGVMVPPYTTTEDGFELQFGANHLGGALRADGAPLRAASGDAGLEGRHGEQQRAPHGRDGL